MPPPAARKRGGPQTIPADTVQGRFNVILGPTDTAGSNIVNAFNGGTTRYLQLTFQGNPILPRQQILAAPVALRALVSDTVTNGAIDTAQIADGSITPAKINGGTGVWLGNGQDIYHVNGNVGIGTSSINSKLHVNGDGIDPSLRVQVNGQSKFIVQTNGGTTIGANTSAPLNGLNVSSDFTAVSGITVSGGIASYSGITVGGKGVVVGEENNLRLVRGVIDGTGTNFVGSGWSVTAHTTGTYTIAFTTAFADHPPITGNTTFNSQGSYAFVTILSQSASGFVIETRTQSGALQNYNIGFIAIGPR